MFPIRDARGRTIGFGGRTLGDGEPKYLNSPETVLFHKGRELYGLYEARQALRNIEQLVVVEGYMDAVALARHGIDFAVATLGTATTPEHLNRLFRLTENVCFAFDGDRAGRKAAWRALETALPHIREGRQIRFVFLPQGHDPDSYVNDNGSDAFVEALDRGMALSDFLIAELAGQVDMQTVDGRARLADVAGGVREQGDVLTQQVRRLDVHVPRHRPDRDVGAGIAVAATPAEIGTTMKRAMARQAEAEREKRAKIIHAEGELTASKKLAEAAAVMETNPITIPLRYLQTLTEISTENASTIVFPAPLNMLEAFLGGKDKS